MKKQIPALFLVLTFVGWILWNRDIYLSVETMLPMDNVRVNVSTFQYIATYLRYFGAFPDWIFTPQGGTWLAPYESVTILLLPNRFIGYWIAALADLPVNLIFKMSFLIVGQGSFLIGCYVLGVKLFSNAWKALVLALLIMFSGITIGTLHQEQGFATVMFVPWIWYLFLTMKGRPLRFVLMAWFIGYSANIFYPQIAFYYLSAVALCSLFTWKKLWNYLSQSWQSYPKPKLTLCVALIAFSLAVMPAVFAYAKYWNKVSSPARNRDHIEAQSYDELVTMQSKLCNVYPANFLRMFGLSAGEFKNLEKHDERVLYAPTLAGFALIAWVFLSVPLGSFQFLLLTMLSMLAIGFYGFMPHLLWYFMPGVNMFRQWVHFIHLFNLHLMFFVVMVLWAFLDRIGKGKKVVGIFLSFALIIPGVVWSHETLNAYRKTLFRHGQETKIPDANGVVKDWFYTHTNAFENGVASFKPRGLSTTFIEDLNLRGPLHREQGGGLVSASDVAMELKDRALQVRVPDRSGDLVFAQFNDGNWRVEDEGGREMGVSSDAHSLLQIESPKAGTLSIRRGFSWWESLVYWMWVPPLAIMVTTLLGFAKHLGLQRFFLWRDVRVVEGARLERV